MEEEEDEEEVEEGLSLRERVLRGNDNLLSPRRLILSLSLSISFAILSVSRESANEGGMEDR